MKTSEIKLLIEWLRESAREHRKLADSLDARADHLRKVVAEQETGELDFSVTNLCKH
jgi:hypothetical protein